MTKLMFAIFILFLVWMLFFHESSYINNRKLDKKIEELETDNNFYKSGIADDEKMIKDLNNPDSLVKYAREQYKMKKKNEEIFLIEFDTVR